MKRYYLIFILVISMVCIPSCGIKPADIIITKPASTTDPQYTNDPRQDNVSNKEISTALSAIKDVIQNKKEYFCTVYSRNIYLKDFHADTFTGFDDNGSMMEYFEDPYNNTIHVYSQFCVLDMDGDGSQEVLLESETTMGNILVFHYGDGVVYGFVFPFRGMKFVEKDGSFESSDSAAVTGVGKIKFSKDKVIYSELCFFDGLDNIYRINGKSVSPEETGAYWEKWRDEKELAIWYPYSEANFEDYFVSY